MVSEDFDSENVYNLLEEIFETSCQEADTSALTNELGELYNSFNGQGFEESFKKILLYVLSEKQRNTDATKILYFISKSSVTLDNMFKETAKKEGVEDIDAVVHPFLKNLFKILTEWSQSSSYIIRYRSCQLLHMILSYIQDYGMGEIDMETFENVAQIIGSRRLDSKSIVRAHAVLLSKFFQDPSTVNDPVITALCFQMQYDPSYHVRQNIVSIIAACEETIVPIAKRFLFDKNVQVRNAALLHICKRIGPRSFTHSQRILILQQCFSDPSDIIRRNSEQKLIPVWFRACEDKLCSFLKYLRFDHESLENFSFIKDLLKVLLKCIKFSKVLEEMEWDATTCLLKLPLSGEKVFLWRQLFLNSMNNPKLSKLIPPLENLIPFILKCFDDSTSDQVEICVFTELILFLMDIMETMGILKCGDVFPMTLNLMRHPFFPKEIMPYLVVLYLTFSPKEKEQVHNDIFEVIADLQKLMLFTENQGTDILLNCFAISSQMLMDESSLTSGIRNIKDNLIVHHLSSENLEVKTSAISALALYCLIDFKEAKLSWSFFENALHIESGPLSNVLLKSAFDILKCYGPKIFADVIEDGQIKFDETVLTLFKCYEDGEEETEIVTQGILKLYLNHLTLSPVILANIIILYFHPEEYVSVQHNLLQFFPKFGDTKDGMECIVKSYLTVINLLFDATKSSPLFEINIKQVAQQLLEFSKLFQNQQKYIEENFQDVLIIKLCKKFLKSPWRWSASDVYSVCSNILPKKFEQLLTLKDLILEIIESLQSSTFQKKNPYAKRSIKSFSTYLKKIKDAMIAMPIVESSISEEAVDSPITKKLDFDSFSSKSNNSTGEGESILVALSPKSISNSTNNDSCSNSSGEESPLKNVSCTRIEILPPEKTPFKKPAPTPRKIATASRNRLSKKTPVQNAQNKESIIENSPYEPKQMSTASANRSSRKTPVHKSQDSMSCPLGNSPFEPRKIATASRSRLSRKTPARNAQNEESIIENSPYEPQQISTASANQSSKKTPAHKSQNTASRNRLSRKTPSSSVHDNDPVIENSPFQTKKTPARK